MEDQYQQQYVGIQQRGVNQCFVYPTESPLYGNSTTSNPLMNQQQQLMHLSQYQLRHQRPIQLNHLQLLLQQNTVFPIVGNKQQHVQQQQQQQQLRNHPDQVVSVQQPFHQQSLRHPPQLIPMQCLPRPQQHKSVVSRQSLEYCHQLAPTQQLQSQTQNYIPSQHQQSNLNSYADNFHKQRVNKVTDIETYEEIHDSVASLVREFKKSLLEEERLLDSEMASFQKIHSHTFVEGSPEYDSWVKTKDSFKRRLLALNMQKASLQQQEQRFESQKLKTMEIFARTSKQTQEGPQNEMTSFAPLTPPSTPATPTGEVTLSAVSTSSAVETKPSTKEIVEASTTQTLVTRQSSANTTEIIDLTIEEQITMEEHIERFLENEFRVTATEVIPDVAIELGTDINLQSEEFNSIIQKEIHRGPSQSFSSKKMKVKIEPDCGDQIRIRSSPTSPSLKLSFTSNHNAPLVKETNVTSTPETEVCSAPSTPDRESRSVKLATLAKSKSQQRLGHSSCQSPTKTSEENSKNTRFPLFCKQNEEVMNSTTTTTTTTSNGIDPSNKEDEGHHQKKIRMSEVKVQERCNTDKYFEKNSKSTSITDKVKSKPNSNTTDKNGNFVELQTVNSKNTPDKRSALISPEIRHKPTKYSSFLERFNAGYKQLEKQKRERKKLKMKEKRLKHEERKQVEKALSSHGDHATEEIKKSSSTRTMKGVNSTKKPEQLLQPSAPKKKESRETEKTSNAAGAGKSCRNYFTDNMEFFKLGEKRKTSSKAIGKSPVKKPRSSMDGKNNIGTTVVRDYNSAKDKKKPDNSTTGIKTNTVVAKKSSSITYSSTTGIKESATKIAREDSSSDDAFSGNFMSVFENFYD